MTGSPFTDQQHSRVLNKRNIFLLDGLGAVVSCLFLGLVLPALQPYIGMPLFVLYGLAALAFSFALYSLSCYYFADHNNPKWLLGIITLNLSYCLLSLILLMRFWGLLTPFGATYFIAEKLIVLGIVSLEWRVRARLVNQEE